MADGLKLKHPQDASRVNLSEDWEVRYWTQTLRISRERLAQLVKDHGTCAAAVHSALGR